MKITLCKRLMLELMLEPMLVCTSTVFLIDIGHQILKEKYSGLLFMVL